MRVYVVLGPTASGKTDLAVEIAKKVGGEVISADSMQIYKEMDIGTAKPTTEEMQGIKHHLIDIVYPNEEYSVAMFKAQAKALIADMQKRGVVPVICGGTGLYINSITYNLDFTQTKRNEELRGQLEKLSNEELHNRLRQIDENSAQRIHINDKKRLIRQLEILNDGESGSGYDFNNQNKEYDFVICGIATKRELLYEKINKRVDIMVQKGLFEEAIYIYKKYGDTQAIKAIGYKEIIENEFSKNSFSLTKEEITEKIKQNTRRFAKRQITWFKRDNRIKWFDATIYNNNNIVSELTNE